MRKSRMVRKDHVAAMLMMAMGIAIMVIGFRYRMGSLVHMGAGFIPVVLGVLMTAVGLVIGLLATSGTPEEKAAQKLPDPPTCAAACILGGVAVFVLLGTFGGMMPAAFGSVFVAAMGDREEHVEGVVAARAGDDRVRGDRLSLRAARAAAALLVGLLSPVHPRN